MPKVIDLFCGIGGLSLGFKNNGFEIACANEYDKEISQSFQANNPNTIMYENDINDLDIYKTFSEYIGIDLIVGGPPCQGFSQKGKRLGIYDKRNFLFRKYLEIIELIKPKVFLIENVPNILTTNKGFFIKDIKEHFYKSNYKIYSSILNSYDYGVPQKRKRAFIVGSSTGKEFFFPEIQKKFITVEEAISDLPVLESGQGKEYFPYIGLPKSKYQIEMRKNSKGIYNHKATKHSDLALKKLSLIPPLGNKFNLPKELSTKSIYSGTWSRINPNGPTRTITTRFDTPSSGEFTLNDQDRCLTVREAARIQSFPDKIIFYGSKQSQMKQVGNAVPPLLAKAISNSILKIL